LTIPGFSTTGDMIEGDVIISYYNSSGPRAEQFSLEGKSPPTKGKFQSEKFSIERLAGCPSSSKVCPTYTSPSCCNNAEVLR
jgi:hypothetical protein